MWRPIGAMRREAPARRPDDRGQPVAMRGDPADILLAHRLDAADQDLVAVFDALETHAAVEGQGLLRRVENLQEMAAQAAGGELRDHSLNVLERRQKVA